MNGTASGVVAGTGGRRVCARAGALTLLTPEGGLFTADGEGRLLFSSQGGWFLARGLDGRALAKRWKGREREVRPLGPSEAGDVLRRYQEEASRLRRTFGPEAVLFSEDIPLGEVAGWLERAAAFDHGEDARRFKAVYRPVGILPPDQYGTVVLQTTEGCAWNRCVFCDFYRGQPFRAKSAREFAGHAAAVKTFFGRGLSARSSLFLGEANALAVPAGQLAEGMSIAQKALVPRMGPFRGFFAFAEPHEARVVSPEDFRVLAGAGLRRLYYGLETGHPMLRRALRKPGDMEGECRSIRAAKSAGISIGLIVLLGAGGREGETAHVAGTASLIERLPLDGKDIVYFSPLQGEGGAGVTPLDRDGLLSQGERLRAFLPRGVRSAVYDIREFVY